MAMIDNFIILEAPLLQGPQRRKLLVERMARDLIKYDAVADERDAIRSLVWSGGYSAVDVMMLVDDARQVAMQEIVAREMSQP